MSDQTDTTTQDTTTNGGGNGSAVRHVPYDRFEQVNRERQTFREQAEAHAKAAAEQKARADRAESERTALEHRYHTDLAMVQTGIVDPEVRDFVRERYDRLRAADGEKAPSFADWYTAQRANPSPILRPFFTPAEPAKEPEVKQPAPTETRTQVVNEPTRRAPEQRGADKPAGGTPVYDGAWATEVFRRARNGQIKRDSPEYQQAVKVLQDRKVIT